MITSAEMPPASGGNHDLSRRAYRNLAAGKLPVAGSVQKVWASADESCPSVASTAKINAPVDIKTLEEDAADGDVDAALNLAQEYTLTKDVKAAEKWYRFALYKGDGRGSLGLYDLHKSGLLKLDDAENVRQYGLNLIEEDARKGNGGSAITLGRFALYGENRPRNADEARDWFTLAEKAGKPMASYFLGLMYSNGLDYDSLPRVAFHYFEKAAAAGIAPATRQVAIAYHTGIGAEKILRAPSPVIRVAPSKETCSPCATLEIYTATTVPMWP